MSLTGIGILAVIAVVISVPTVLLIPHARQSPVFNRLLWIATFAIAFLGGWLGLGYADSSWASAMTFTVADIPVFPVIVGEVGSVIALNLLLLLLDLFDRPPEEAGQIDDEPPLPDNSDQTL